VEKEIPDSPPPNPSPPHPCRVLLQALEEDIGHLLPIFLSEARGKQAEKAGVEDRGLGPAGVTV
jgi:hypothetical protein